MAIVVAILVVAVVVLVIINRNNIRAYKGLKKAHEDRDPYVIFADSFENAVIGNLVGAVPDCNFGGNHKKIVDTVELISMINAAKKTFDRIVVECDRTDVSGEVDKIQWMIDQAKSLAEHTQHFLGIEASSMLAQLSEIEHTGNVSQSRYLLQLVSAELERLLSPFADLSGYMRSRNVDRSEVGIQPGDPVDTMLDLSDKVQKMREDDPSKNSDQ